MPPSPAPASASLLGRSISRANHLSSTGRGICIFRQVREPDGFPLGQCLIGEPVFINGPGLVTPIAYVDSSHHQVTRLANVMPGQPPPAQPAVGCSGQLGRLSLPKSLGPLILQTHILGLERHKITKLDDGIKIAAA